MRKQITGWVTLVVATAVVAVVPLRERVLDFFLTDISFLVPTAHANRSLGTIAIKTIAAGLNDPFALTSLPDNSWLATERSGYLVHITSAGKLSRFTVPNLALVPHGGLMGVAVGANYPDDPAVFIYHTYEFNGTVMNRLVRCEMNAEANRLEKLRVLIESVPAGGANGGAVGVGPDGLVYVGTGDAGQPKLAQQPKALAGKLLRVTKDGAFPPDNPFANAVFTLGHHNPRGLAWDEDGRLWLSETSAPGVAEFGEEVNLIQPGSNYGWPLVAQGQRRGTLISPRFGSKVNFAPAGIAIWQQVMFVAGEPGELVMLQVDRPFRTPRRFRNEMLGQVLALSVRGDELSVVSRVNSLGTGSELVTMKVSDILSSE